MSIRKLGVFGIVAALLLAFGAFGLSTPGSVHADVDSITADPADEFDSGTPVEITVVADDDDGSLTISTDLGILNVVDCSDGNNFNEATCNSNAGAAISGGGTSTVVVNTANIDVDNNDEEFTIVLELVASCADDTEVTVTADQDETTDDVTITCLGDGGAPGDGELEICEISSTATKLAASETVSLTGFTGNGGVWLMQVGQNRNFTVWLTGDLGDNNGMDVNLDDDGGDSDIVSLRGAAIPATDHLNVTVVAGDATTADRCEVDDEFIATFRVTVDVTCDIPGRFDLSFALEEGNAMSTTVICGGFANAVTLTATPATVEIVPAAANTAHSLIRAVITDATGGFVPFAEVGNITWTVSKCAIGSVSTHAGRAALSAAAGGLPGTGAAPLGDNSFHTAAHASAAPTPGSPTTTAGTLLVRTNPADSDTLISEAFAVFHADVAGCTPGPATITIIVDRPGKADLIATTTVNIIGPPASITMSAAPTTVICGEKATITVTVKDAIGQNVSDHTRVELITNFGGVIGGTGGTLGFPGTGPVNPLSSGAAETFNGVATAFLVTSENHTGDYEVIATSGGSALGGVVSTPAVSSQVTVRCTLEKPPAPPSAAPHVQAPSAGVGTGAITPPRTGDAGLVAADSSSASLFVIAGAVAFVLAGLASLKFARTR